MIKYLKSDCNSTRRRMIKFRWRLTSYREQYPVSKSSSLELWLPRCLHTTPDPRSASHLSTSAISKAPKAWFKIIFIQHKSYNSRSTTSDNLSWNPWVQKIYACWQREKLKQTVKWTALYSAIFFHWILNKNGRHRPYFCRQITSRRMIRVWLT